MSRLNMNQTSILERSLSVNEYPNKAALKELALQTGLDALQVYNWFAKKRRRAGGKKSGKHYHFLSFIIHVDNRSNMTYV